MNLALYRPFDLFSNNWFSPFNTYDNDTSYLKHDDQNYYLRYEVPGYTEENIKLELVKNSLHISGETEGEGMFKSKGQFSVKFTLPKDIDLESEALKAECKAGVLFLTIPRKIPEKPKTKLIPFKSG